jgi:TetR/AcrR family transcriptional regulator, cholesterol catabolism regulator
MTREVISMEGRPTLTAKGQAAQNRVIAEALKLFQKQGYVATSIREIADAAGLAKATVYHHYATKADILYEIHSIFIETLEEGMEQIEGSGEPAVERLRMIIHELWRVMITHRPHVQVFFEDWRYLDGAHLKALRKRRDGYYRFVRGTVAESLDAKGASVSKEHVDVLTLAIFGMCNWGYQWFDPKGTLKADEIAEDYADLVIDAFSMRGGGR